MKNPLSLVTPISRYVGMVRSTNERWLRSRRGQFARARRPTAER